MLQRSIVHHDFWILAHAQSLQHVDGLWAVATDEKTFVPQEPAQNPHAVPDRSVWLGGSLKQYVAIGGFENGVCVIAARL